MTETQRNTYCDRCHGAIPAAIIWGATTKMCECPSLGYSALGAIQEVDPEGEMFFETLKDPHPTVVEARKMLEDIVDGVRERGVIMLGLPGRGKTHLAVATARALMVSKQMVGFYSLAEMVSRIQATYGFDDSDETRDGIIRRLCLNDVVILDDIGKEHRSSNVESIVYELINRMYNQRVKLIASTNLPGPDFVERYDGAVLSRLGGMCEKVVIKGDDQRSKRWDW